MNILNINQKIRIYNIFIYICIILNIIIPGFGLFINGIQQRSTKNVFLGLLSTSISCFLILIAVNGDFFDIETYIQVVGLFAKGPNCHISKLNTALLITLILICTLLVYCILLLWVLSLQSKELKKVKSTE